MRNFFSAKLPVSWLALMLASGLVVAAPLPGRSVSPEPSQTLAQTSLDALNQQIIELYEQGRYNEAIPLAERHVEMAENQFSLCQNRYY